MSADIPLPFDALRPFKSKPDEFTPRDTLPWPALAERFLDCRTGEGFLYLRPAQLIETHVTWLVETLKLPAGAAILDIGCGPGLYSSRLARYGYQVTGIDIAPAFVEYAQAEAQAQSLTCTYRLMSLFDLAFTAEFELVLLINSIAQLLTPAELESALPQIRAALKPGGHFLGEFAIQPAHLTTTTPTVTENLSLVAQSPWSDQFHAWLIRELTFPATHERVTHHLILTADGQPAEYWSRFTLHAISDLTRLLAAAGLQVQVIFGPQLGQPYQEADTSCFIWGQAIRS